jgi:Flp pilus assembly protein TadD
MINDRMGQILAANNSYKLAIEKCHEDPALERSQIFKKAGTNYAVTLEKLGKRKEAVRQLEKLNKVFTSEVRVFNNLGII